MRKWSKKRLPRKPHLTFAQIEIVGQFSDYAFDYPSLSFNDLAKEVLPEGFGTGSTAKQFRKDAKEVFYPERAPRTD
jgi:hypothetical protein